jgi:Reverse transcriptase (RNA-dependent DNA polymerase)/Endonuclease-reverse transcriptase
MAHMATHGLNCGVGDSSLPKVASLPALIKPPVFELYDFSGPRPSWGRKPYKAAFGNKTTFSARDYHRPPTVPKDLLIWQQNINGLSCNFNALLHAIESASDKPAIICLNETKVRDKFTGDAAFQVEGYESVRRNRGKRSGGGVAVYYQSHLPCNIVLRPSNYECIWLRLKLPGLELLLACCYNPPSADYDIFRFIEDDLLRLYNKYPNAKFALLGDLNLHNPNLVPYCGPTNAAGRSAEIFALAHNLKQIVTEPTYYYRLPDGSLGRSTLDVLFTNASSFIQFDSCLPPIGRADHEFVNFVIKPPGIIKQQRLPKRTLFSYKNTDWIGLNKYLADQDWRNILQTKSVDEAWDRLHRILRNGIHRFTPHKTIRPSYQKPFFNYSLQALLRDKKAKWLAYKRLPLASTINAYKKARNIYCHALRRAKLQHAVNQASSIDGSSPRKFWGFINNNMGRGKSKVQPCLLINDQPTTNPSEIAEELNRVFAGKCMVDGAEDDPPPKCIPRAILRNVQFKAGQVLSELLKLDTNKAAGPDDIPAIILKKCAHVLARPLAVLFHKSFRAGKVPAAWKRANVTAVHKKDSKLDANNYRPISLLCIVGKVMERIINNKLTRFLETNRLLHNSQFGFRKGRSTIQALLSITQPCESSLNSPNSAHRVVTLDISAAFDKVWHRGLLSKLESTGIAGPLLNWLQDYLSERYQRVVYSGVPSSWRRVGAGVPQGSILGPTLFLTYINDLPNVLQSPSCVFADDTTIHASFANPAGAQSTTDSINRDLVEAERWGSSWKVSFNHSKTASTTVSRKNVKLPDLIFAGHVVKDASNVTLLGVKIDCKLDWQEHIKSISARASKTYGALMKARPFFTEKTAAACYKGLIRPSMEYCSPVWSSATATALAPLDKIQRNCNRLFPSIRLDSLAHRRRIADLAVFHRLRSGSDVLPKSLQLPGPFPRPRNTRQSTGLHDAAVEVPTGNKKYESSFFPRAARLWNALPQCLVQIQEAKLFRQCAHRHLLTGILPPVAS